MSAPTATATRPAVSHELTAFLVELSVALHKHTMYPSGHPSLEPAVARVTERATRLLEERPMLAFGVARHQLIIDGVATDPNQPVLRRLAETLHQHHLGAVSILPGVESGEISSAIRVLAQDAGAEAAAIGREFREWPHVRLHQLTLERLELVDDEPSADVHQDEKLDRHAAQLWIGLANAAMAMEADRTADASVTDPLVVAKAIDDHTGAAAYDQVIVGYLLQIADELKGTAASDQGPLRRRTARLIGALQPETLERLLAMGGDVAQRQAFVRGATSGMAVDSVLKIVKAAAHASQQTISHGLLRMLSKLASHAEVGLEETRPEADVALREQVDRLLSGWNLDDPSPDAYSKALQRLASQAGPEAVRDDGQSDHEADPVRLLQISLEVGGSGPLVERAIERALDAGAVRALLALLSSPPGEDGNTAADILLQRLGSARAMSALVAREPLDFETLDALLPSLSADGYEVLLDTLIASESRTTRRRLIDRLTRTRLDVAPLITARLDDGRWYVQRNLLLLLERIRRVPPGFDLTWWTQHPDTRVRYQALALQLILPKEREGATCAAIADPDPRIIRLGLVAAQRNCPLEIVPVLANLATNSRMTEELRVLAVAVLGRSRQADALAALLQLVHGGNNFLGRPKLAPPTPVVLAALRALAAAWSTEKEAQHFLALARRSFTGELRQAAARA